MQLNIWILCEYEKLKPVKEQYSQTFPCGHLY